MSEFLRKLRWSVRRREKDAELREELEFHLAKRRKNAKQPVSQNPKGFARHSAILAMSL